MNHCISYSPRASLAIVGMNIQQMGIWDMIDQKVKIQQKTVVHTPLQKLQDAFINIMAGGHGNQRSEPSRQTGCQPVGSFWSSRMCRPVGN